jgi:hypothetical protein
MNKNSLYLYTNRNTETCIWYYKGKAMTSYNLKSFQFMAELHNIIHESLDTSLDTKETLEGVKMLVSLEGKPAEL